MHVPWKMASAWTNCLSHIASIRMRVSHIFKERNMVADCLSKMAISMVEDHWSTYLPESYLHFHALDLWGDKKFMFK